MGPMGVRQSQSTSRFPCPTKKNCAPKVSITWWFQAQGSNLSWTPCFSYCTCNTLENFHVEPPKSWRCGWKMIFLFKWVMVTFRGVNQLNFFIFLQANMMHLNLPQLEWANDLKKKNANTSGFLMILLIRSLRGGLKHSVIDRQS